MTEEERKRFSHFFDTSKAYLSEKVELPSYKKLQNLIGFILSIVIIIYSSISYLLFVIYQVPLPFYLVDVLLSILSIFLFFFYRKSASHRSSHQYRPHHFSLISDLGARHMFTETLNDIMAKRLLSREKLSEITGVNVTLIDEWLNGTKEPDERQIRKLSEKLNISISSYSSIQDTSQGSTIPLSSSNSTG